MNIVLATVGLQTTMCRSRSTSGWTMNKWIDENQHPLFCWEQPEKPKGGGGGTWPQYCFSLVNTGYYIYISSQNPRHPITSVMIRLFSFWYWFQYTHVGPCVLKNTITIKKLFCETRWPRPPLFSPSWLIQWSMGEGSYITLFPLSNVTTFHRMKYGWGGVI